MGFSEIISSTGMRSFSLRQRLGLGLACLVLPLLLLTFSGYLLFHMTLEDVDGSFQEVVLRFIPVTTLQETLLRSLMPPNDYLIHGDPDDRRRFELLRIEVDQGFDRAQASPFQDPRRNASVAEARLLWTEAARLAEEILSLEQPQGNPAGASRMEKMDDIVDEAYTRLEYVCSAIVSELGTRHSMLQALSIKMGIVIVVFVVLVTIVILVGFLLIKSWIIAPLKELESGAQAFADGKFEHRIPERSNDEIASVARTFNVMAAELKRDRDNLRDLSIHDQLTGLFNRKEFQRLLDLEIARSQRHGRVLALLMVDVDYFKTVNDRYGHPVGDVVLRCVADRIYNALRPNDVVARYGGEEFIVMLPETNGAGAMAIAERLCEQVRATPMDIAQGIRPAVSVSVGVAVYPLDTDTAESLIAAADRALYAAKDAGRDRCCSYADLAALA